MINKEKLIDILKESKESNKNLKINCANFKHSEELLKSLSNLGYRWSDNSVLDIDKVYKLHIFNSIITYTLIPKKKIVSYSIDYFVNANRYMVINQEELL